MGMTPQQVIDTVRFQFYETAAKFVSDNEVRSYMWQAEMLLASMLECTETTNSATTTVIGTQEYAKPTNCALLQRVEWYGVKLKKIDLTDQDAIDFGGYGAAVATGQCHSYYEYGSVIGLYPVPSSAQTLKFYYAAEPTLTTGASTAFTVAGPLTKYLADYVLYRLYAKDQDNGRAGFHNGLWEQGLINARQEWARIKRRDMHSVVRTEDFYPSTDLGLI